LVAVVVGLGAVLTIDWCGLLWLIHRRSLVAVLRTAYSARVLVWLGLGGLLVSGYLLGPQVSSVLTMVKLVAVLLVALNGLYLDGLARRLLARRGKPTRSMLIHSGASLLVSQCGWWTAMVIGYMST
jgi:hypothetical protein